MYTEKVLDHFSHPRNMGELKDANGVGMVGNAKCGDIMQMFLKIDDDGIIEDVGFKTFGCGASSVVSSPRVSLTEPCAISWGSPRASSTWEGSSEPEVQAEPDEAAMPFISSISSMDSPSMNFML